MIFDFIVLIVATLGFLWLCGGLIVLLEDIMGWIEARVVAWFGPLWSAPPHWSRKGPCRPSNPVGIPGDSRN